ncbi:MAG TPA: hypothetical protein VFC51_15410 [Chloroflexota bacterium]|nr:hypothetical protein [Chloroflexota bacterium]
MLTYLWSVVRRLSHEHLLSAHLSGNAFHPRTMQPILAALHDIGYVLPGSHGHPTRLLYQELNRRGTLIWRAA